jgi:tetratricopeptide (TPR) repeat protein
MARFRGLLIAALVLLVMPAAVSAQRDNEHTREATKHIGLAMTRQDDAERQQMYQQALTALEEGIREEPDHAKTWLLAGAVYAALARFDEADAAFDKAVALHPAYEADIATEREQAWIHAFNAGVARMDAQDYAGAIAALEAANMLYPDRPEAYLNLGSLYAGENQPEKAADALEKALAVVTGPRLQEVTPEMQQHWTNYAELARINIAQLRGQAGINAFEADDFMRAAEMFQAAAEVNPYSRDFHFNFVQALFAQTQRLEEQRDSALARAEAAAGADKTAAEAEVARINAELTRVYDDMLAGVSVAQPLDPNNEMLYIIGARAHRMKGVIAGTEDAVRAGQERALAQLTAREALAVHVSGVSVRSNDGSAVVSGTVTNRTVAAGSPVVLRLTLVGVEGETVGEGEITVSAPAADEDATFEGSIPVTGEIAGWRYQVVGS